MTINIIPLGGATGTDNFNCFKDKWKSLCSCKSWYGNRVKILLKYCNDNIIRVSGGQVKLKERTITIVSEPFDLNRRNQANYVKEWSDKYQMVVLICEAKELLEQYELRSIVASCRGNMSTENDNIYLFIKDIDNVVNIPTSCNYSAAYVGACKTMFGDTFDKVRLKEGYDTLSWYSIVQSFIFCKYKGKEISFPHNVMCNMVGYEYSGYMELLIIAMDRLLQPEFKLTNRVLTTIKLYDKMAIKALSKRIKLAVIGTTNAGKSWTIDDINECLGRTYGFVYENCPREVRGTRIDFSKTLAASKEIKGRKMAHTPFKDGRPSIGIFKNRYDAFCLEILDIPGETFDENNYDRFTKVLAFIAANLSREIEYQEPNKPGNKRKVRLFDALEGMYDVYDIVSVKNGLLAWTTGNNQHQVPEGFDDYTMYEEFMNKAFAYLYFVMISTDIVMCHNIADTDNETKDDKVFEYGRIIKSLTEILDAKDNTQNDKSWLAKIGKSVINFFAKLWTPNRDVHKFLNIRGVDVMMDVQIMQKYYRKFDNKYLTVKRNCCPPAPMAYTLFCMSVYENLNLDDGHGAGRSDFMDSVYPSIKKEIGFIDDMGNPTNDSNEAKTCFKPNMELNYQLKSVMINAMEAFGIDNSIIPQHVFLTSTPIASKYAFIDRFEGQKLCGYTFDPTMRELFGTVYLVADILLSRDISIDEERVASFTDMIRHVIGL